MRSLDAWRQRAKQLKTDVYAVYLACKDPRTPWYAKILIACIVGYAFSPIDLIPDFMPVLGYVDDLILIPIGIALALKMIPAAVLADCRIKAQATMARKRPKNWFAASTIVAIWLLLALLAIFLISRVIKG